MAFAVVIGIVLKVETIGYDGPPPVLPKEPVATEQGRDGLRRFIYDLTPPDRTLSVEDACARIGSRLDRMLNSPKPALPDGPHATRLTLDFGILADREDQSFRYSWSPEFLRTLVDAEINLNVSHYLPSPDQNDDA